VCVRESLGAHAELELFRGGRREEVQYEDRAAFVKMKVQKQLMEPVEEQIAAIREGMEGILTNGDYKWPDVFGVLTEEVGFWGCSYYLTRVGSSGNILEGDRCVLSRKNLVVV
jgi:hypothetical protein